MDELGSNGLHSGGPRFQGDAAALPLGGAVTPPHVLWNRRQLVRRLGLAALGLTVGGCRATKTTPPSGASTERFPIDLPSKSYLPAELPRQEPSDGELAARHNNFYEFLPGKGGDVAPYTRRFATSPWSVDVHGACDRPRTFDLESLHAFPHEERLYHFRCVERWAMNVPWVGFPLWRLLEAVQPRPEARWVTFTSAADPGSMPGIEATPHYPWPYHEALRLDEALHDLSFLATGIYGAPLPRQHGAPVRLVVPWKYGYKSAKSLLSIELVEETPSTFWHSFAPHEYGLLSNVNPNIPHPRWNQYHSFWLRDHPTWPTAEDIFPTAMFNGYEAEVGALYPDEPRTRQVPLKPGETAR